MMNFQRAERKAGELLREMAAKGERAGGHGGDRKSSNTVLLDQLPDLAVTRMQSSRWQQIAAQGSNFDT
jgi:hypothetical protein